MVASDDDSVASDDDSSRRLLHSDSSSEEELQHSENLHAVNPDTFEDFFETEDHWLTEDHLFELQTARDAVMKAPPPLSSWELREETSEVEVTVAKARRMAWEQGKAEIRLHKKNVARLPSGSSDIHKVYQYMFGSKSRVCRLFNDKLGISNEEYLRFILTYIKSCKYKTSVADLNKFNDTFPLLMPTEQYNQIWSSIVKLTRHAHGESFWQELESLFNSIYGDLFMEAATDQLDDGEEVSSFLYQIGLDDDKLHYNWGNSTKSDGLKRGHHAKDNRHGFTAHTACNAATAAPLNVSFQRKHETVRLTTERMIDTMFGQHTGKANRLDNVEIGMDRGYWDAVLLFRLLDQGADIHGTVKRMDWVPLTFKHKGNTFPEQPMDISLEGCRDSYYMNTNWKGKQSTFRKLTCVGYRSGTGNAVSLAISSRYRQVQMDLVPYGNIRWYHDPDLTDFERKEKALTLLVGDDPMKDCCRLILDAVEPRTCDQGTADWFIDRQLSGTSSTIAELVIAVASLLARDHEDESIVEAFEVVLSYAGFKSDEIIGSKVKPAPEEEAVNASDSSSEDSSSKDSELKAEAACWYTTLSDPAVDVDDDLKANMNSMDIVVLSWIVALFKKKDYKLMTKAAARKVLVETLLPSPKERRPYVLLTSPDLRDICKLQNIKTTGLKKDALIDQLLMPTGGQVTRQKQTKKKEDLEAELLPMYTLFKQSYLRQQPGKERAAARIGHRNEEPFLKSFFELCNNDSNSNSTPAQYSFESIDPVAIFRLGLVQKKGSRFVKASLDGVTVIKTKDDDLELLPTEVKSRVSTSTMNEAMDRVAVIVGAELYNPRAQYLIHVRSSDTLLRLLIHDEANPKRKNSECFQLLHSAFAIGSIEGLLLVGSMQSLLYAVKVAFEPTLLEAYAKVMDFIYNTQVKQFYESSVTELKANEKIDQVLEHIEYMDKHAFWTNYMLWRALNVDVRATTRFPLPPCARCLPFQNAVWNQLKGPSDTTTKLLDSFEEQLGIRTPRTIATARLLSIGAIAFHRSTQMLSAKPTLEYATLYDYRHAANSRFSMSQSLFQLLEFMQDDYKNLVSPVLAVPQVTFGPTSTFMIPPNTPPRKTRAGDEAPQRVTWSYYEKTGFTPMRGRPANLAHKLREKSCDGRVLVAVVKDPNSNDDTDPRQKCRLCGNKTNHYCTGCKNYLCFGTAQGLNGTRIDTLMERDTDNLFAGELRPKTILKMMSFDSKSEAWIPVFAKNCCYLVHHREAFNALWEDKHAKEADQDKHQNENSDDDTVE